MWSVIDDWNAGPVLHGSVERKTIIRGELKVGSEALRPCLKLTAEVTERVAPLRPNAGLISDGGR